MKLKLLQMFLVLMVVSLFANAQECGTIADSETIEELSILNGLSGNLRVSSVEDKEIRLAITPHIIRNSAGEGGLREDQLWDAIDLMNDFYTGVGLQFFVPNREVNYVDNDEFVDFDSSQEPAIIEGNNVANTINIYFFNSLSSGESALCGYAYFPNSGRDQIMMSNSCTTGGATTLSHEVGHYLALYHTHGKSNTGTTDELVDGSNCTFRGDDVCDTPADPNLSRLVDSGDCGYFGALVDENGETYTPDARNVMSYSIGRCRYLFSEGQKERMFNAYQTFKTYLNTEDFFAKAVPAQHFVCVGSELKIANESCGFTTVEWDAEDATISSSTEDELLVSFQSAGYKEYTLTLTDGSVSKVLRDSVFVYNAISDAVDSTYISFDEENPRFLTLDEDGRNPIQVVENSGRNNSKALAKYFFEDNLVGSFDYVLLPEINTQVYNNFELVFDISYALHSSERADGLQVVQRNDCNEWVVIWEQSGEELATVESTSFYAPREDDWKTVRVEFESALENTEIALRTVNGFGNNLYLDNIYILPNDPLFSISSLAVSNATCPGDEDGMISVLLSGDDVTNLEFSLDNVNYSNLSVFENIKEGEYIVYVKSLSSGIIESRPVIVESTSTFPNKPVVFRSGDRLILGTSLFPGQSVEWYFNDELIEGENGTDLTIDGRKGFYTVAISNGICASFSEPEVVLSVNVELEIVAYPNPVANGRLYLKSSEDFDGRKFEIYDTSGKSVKSVVASVNEIELDGLTEGIYFIKINTKILRFAIK